MELFVCSSHYQLLNAIMIVREYNLTADILVTRESIWRECNLDVLCHNVFIDIYKWTSLLEKLGDENINGTYDRVRIQIKKIITYLDRKKIWNSIPNKDKQYSIVHIAYVDSVSLWVYSLFKKTSGAQLSLYEDGTYTYGCLSIKKTLFRRIAEKLLYGDAGIENCMQIYVKHPNKINLCNYDGIKILRIGGKADNAVLESIILPLYNISMDMLRSFNAQILIFDQNIEIQEIKELQKEIAKIASVIFAKSNVVVKIHPSSRDIDYDNDINVFRGRLPFEAVMAYEPMDNKVLISIFSTAGMSPKLDCDSEPYVIFTYRIFKNLKIDNNYIMQIQQLRDSYKDASKVMVPNTIDELRAMLEDIKGCL